MKKIDYANRIFDLTTEHPEVVILEDPLTLEELMFNSVKELRLLYQVYLDRLANGEIMKKL